MTGTAAITCDPSNHAIERPAPAAGDLLRRHLSFTATVSSIALASSLLLTGAVFAGGQGGFGGFFIDPALTGSGHENGDPVTGFGGRGGNANTGAAGGAGGSIGADGGTGNSGDDGGGGGGGGSGRVVTTPSTNTTTVQGGAGGAGGTGLGFSDSSGGGGGGGGAGTVANDDFTNTGTILGGDGGRGGNGGSEGNTGGGGGGGGAGILATSPVTIVNSGSIAGGDGGGSQSGNGAAGSGFTGRGGAGEGGALGGTRSGTISGGGAGIVGSGLTVINAGSISGGLSGNGARANAITFTGGANSLELQAGYGFVGNVDATSAASASLALGGTAASSFDVGLLGASLLGFTSFTKSGASTWTLTGTTAQATPWLLQQGTLRISVDSLGNPSDVLTFDGGTLGTTATLSMARNVQLQGAGTVDVANGTTTTLTGIVGGAGSLSKAGGGTLTLSGANTYLGGTIVDAGTLLLAGSGTLGGAAGSTRINAGLLDLGRKTQVQNGGLVLTGGALANGTLSSSGTFDLQAGTVSAVLGGTGNAIKSGTGKATLSGVNTYTGTTTVTQGILEVASGGSVASATSVNGGSFIVNGTAGAVSLNGGLLGGSGTTGAAQVNSGGKLAPGNSIGTMTVTDSLTFAAGSTYEVEVSATAADRVNVVAGSAGTGTASLSGGTVVPIYEPGSYVAKSYIILSAAGGLGGTQFASLSGSAPTGFTQRLAYDASTVQLVLDLQMRETPAPEAPAPEQPATPATPADPYGNLSRNQDGVRDAIVGYFDANGGIASEFAALSPEGLTQASAETAAAGIAAGQQAADQFLATISGPRFGDTGGSAGPDTPPLAYAPGDAATSRIDRAFGAGFGTGVQPAAPISNWQSWGAAYGVGALSQGDAGIGSSDITAQSWGLVAGHDVAFGGTSLGVALGGGWGSYSLDNGFGQGTTGSFHAGLRGTQEFGAAYLSGALAYGYHAFSTSRTVTGERYDADYTGHSLSGRAEAGWRVAVLPGSTFTPYGAVETVALFTPSYGENASGAGLFALNYQAQETVSTRLELGARLEHVIALGDKPLTLSGRAAYQHNLDPQRDVTAGFATLAGTSFVTNAAAASRNSLLLTLGADYALASNVSLGLAAAAAIGDASRAIAGRASFKVRW